MKLSQIIKSKFKDQRGAVAVIVAVSMLMLIGFLALAIDVGYLYATKNELQNAADAAALAGAGALGNYYTNTTDPFTSDKRNIVRNIVVTAVQDVVGSEKNSAGGKDISIDGGGGSGEEGDPYIFGDIFINNYVNAGTTFDEDNYTQPPDAVRVIARRDSEGTPFKISTFFAKIFNIDSLPVWADATAALTGVGIAGPGGLPLPIAINKGWMDTIPCNENLTLNPSSGDVCAAWHHFTEDNGYGFNSSPTTGMRGLIDDITDFTYESPETIAGVTEFDFTNGTQASIFTHDNMQNLFDDRRVRDDGILDMDENPDTWTLTVPIFDDSELSTCSPSGPIVIVGFASITITSVVGPSENQIYATVKCEEVKPVRGGGAEYGTKGSIPGLIE